MNSFAEILDVRIGKVCENLFNVNAPESSSAIRKKSVGRAMLGELGFLGDEVAERAFHGGLNKAILLFSLDSYREISEQCHVDFEKIKSAGFGENLLISGRGERDICVGDVLECESVMIEISQPRQPCWKLSLNHDTHDLALRLYELGLTGFYARVLHGGEVSAGSSFRLVKRPFPHLSIFALNSLVRDPSSNLELTLEALSCPALSPNFHASLKTRLECNITTPPEYIYVPK
ncbi:MAG: MOSC domain-containing protein [Wolinella sp.]